MTPNEARALTFHDCCKAIVDDCKRIKASGIKLSSTMSHAWLYAEAGLQNMPEGSESACCQAGYILANLAYWRHSDAPVIRARLKQIQESR